jgi:acetyl/propionyl-CoA carboxylase alpha subunit
VAGVDLVRAQFVVAAGGGLPWTQESLVPRGHAIECRIYAEDTADGFLPQAGPLLLYREPSGPGIRVDSGVVEGGTVPVHYDPLLAKLTASAESRPAALARAVAALRTFPILGILTNVPFLIRLLEHPEIRAGRMHTRFIEEHAGELLTVPDPPLEALAAAALGTVTSRRLDRPAARSAPDPWATVRDWGRDQ